MAYNEEDFLMLSGIEHFYFCSRQWALIHIEHLWAENFWTVDGSIMHERAHDKEFVESRGDLLVTRGMQVMSREMGVTGACDVVEFHRCADGITLSGREGLWEPYPVEYKRGKPNPSSGNALQLCGQAMCWKKCYAARFRRVPYIMGSCTAGRRCSLHPSCARRCGQRLRKCTGCMSVAIRPRSSPPKPAMPALSGSCACPSS